MVDTILLFRPRDIPDDGAKHHPCPYTHLFAHGQLCFHHAFVHDLLSVSIYSRSHYAGMLRRCHHVTIQQLSG